MTDVIVMRCPKCGYRYEPVREDCRTCGGLGTIPGFLLGTVKRCPACDGKGVRG